MAESPQDFTRAGDTVSKLSDRFAANADAKSVYMGNRSMWAAELSFLLQRSDIWSEPLLADGTARLLEGAAEGAELEHDLSVTSKSRMRGRVTWSCRPSKRRSRSSSWDL